MALDPAPFDVVEATRRVWLDRWDEESASGVAVFTALFRSYQMLRAQVDEVVRAHGLTFPRYEVLAWLATDPEPSLTLTWISKTLRIPPATVTGIIDHLEQEGLLERQTHPDDGRTTLAVITAKGRDLVTAATSDLNESVYRRIALSQDEREHLTDLLRTLREAGDEFDADRSVEVIEALGS